ncbi:YceD family protein [Streptococcus uberis]|uniref:YceD family protein n=1 Tax=Streptococcus uberis TaxID=1349 RepID=UPI00062026E7|nr:YceD family protein [Streptococcus uberis]KKF46577.1 DNA-binding protein [Streptococcus uberis C8329]
MIFISDLKKKQEPVHFKESLDIKDKLLERNKDILDIKDVLAIGTVSYEEGIFLLNYQLSYTLTMPSSRSMKAVTLYQENDINELFIEESQITQNKDIVEEELVLILSGETIDIEESVIDNILLDIPLQVLAPEEENSVDMPKGKEWTVLTEEQYQSMKADTAKENNPFASLNGLFDE